MFRSLYAKLVLVLLLVFLLIGLTFVVVARYVTEVYQQEATQKLNRTLAANIVQEKPIIRNGQVDQAALKEIFTMLMVINPSIEVYLLAEDGRILAYSAPPGRVKRERVDLAPVQRFLDGDAAFPLLGDDPRAQDRHKIFSAAPVGEENGAGGYLYVILESESFTSVAQMLQTSQTLRLGAITAGSGVIVALLTGLWLFALVTRRLRRLSHAMDQFKRKDFFEPVVLEPTDSDTRQQDEIGRLAATFREMAARIADQMQQLKQTDDKRREMVANVSHDLRTPLASLNGYLETLLLKGDSLSAEEQRQYVEIAAKHSHHLSQLVDELFELAKLDALDKPVHLEQFSLAELAQDALQKFSLKGSERGITLESRFDGQVPLVQGDIALIVRVLENLIENALRHTPKGGTITIELIPGTERITARISDTGCGIPEDELPQIFDRFYRLEKSRHEGSGGAGLGLAIVRRILELHGSQIEAANRNGGGTTFSFALPAA